MWGDVFGGWGEQRIGILGGTFDPVHYGHLLAALEARSALSLDQVLFMPCGEPPHKPHAGVSPAEDRYLMTALAVAAYPNCRVSRLEMERPGPSYTVDTLRQLRDDFGPGTSLYFIAGTDAFLSLPSWKDWQELPELARLVVVARPGTGDADLSAAMSRFAPEFRHRILIVTIPALAISGRDLRQRAAAGKDLRPYVPPPVWRYIQERGLYRAGVRTPGTNSGCRHSQ